MRIYELGARVYGSVGELQGRMTQLIVAVETLFVSHAVVYSPTDGRARLVPFAMTRPALHGIRLSGSPPRFAEILPVGTVPVRQREPVLAIDGSAGFVYGVVLAENTDSLTHIVVAEKLSWIRTLTTIPVEGLAEITHESIRVRWSRQTIKELPQLMREGVFDA